MKMIHSFRSNILLIAGLIAVVLTMSFRFARVNNENRDKAEKIETVSTVYHYVSSDMSEGAFAVPSNWDTANSNGECGEPRPIRPCQITVAAGSSLSTVLNGKDNSGVLAISESYKAAP